MRRKKERIRLKRERQSQGKKEREKKKESSGQRTAQSQRLEWRSDARDVYSLTNYVNYSEEIQAKSNGRNIWNGVNEI